MAHEHVHIPVDLKPKPYRFPPVDPGTGEVSAWDGAIHMGQMAHRDVPPPHRRADCDAKMDDHEWYDVPTTRGLGVVVCPDGNHFIPGGLA